MERKIPDEDDQRIIFASRNFNYNNEGPDWCAGYEAGYYLGATNEYEISFEREKKIAIDFKK